MISRFRGGIHGNFMNTYVETKTTRSTGDDRDLLGGINRSDGSVNSLDDVHGYLAGLVRDIRAKASAMNR